MSMTDPHIAAILERRQTIPQGARWEDVDYLLSLIDTKDEMIRLLDAKMICDLHKRRLVIGNTGYSRSLLWCPVCAKGDPSFTVPAMPGRSEN